MGLHLQCTAAATPVVSPALCAFDAGQFACCWICSLASLAGVGTYNFLLKVNFLPCPSTLGPPGTVM
jgi:hypothetical protein